MMKKKITQRLKRGGYGVHFLGGLIVALLGAVLSPEAGLYAAIVVGLAMEFKDWQKGGTPDGMDALATISGGILAIIIALII